MQSAGIHRPSRHIAGLCPCAALLCLAFATSASAQSQEGAQARSMQTVTVVFDARVNGKPAACGETYQGVGKTGAALFLQDFRVYVSAVRLLAQDGSEVPVMLTPDQVWQNDRVALLDFENGSGNCNGNAPTNHHVKGTVPAGEYRGIAFDVGVPFELNHQDPALAPAPLNYSALTWPWRAGYKFTTIDFDTQSASARKMVPIEGTNETRSATGFSVHLGSTGCVSSGMRVPPQTPCANSNRPTYRFDTFDSATQVVVLDLGALLAGTDVTMNTPKTASGCMSSPDDDDCVDIMNRFGLPFRGKPSSGQQFVHIGTR